jgi:PHD/YefM family antitoxin component YafN of YafNO toxin-antitoxin module
MKNIEYVTDENGKKKRVLLPLADFEKLQGDLEDLEDALELEKARRDSTGFKKWRDFVREIDAHRKEAYR